MARKKDPPKSLYPLKHEFDDSLKNVLNEAGMLLTMADTIVRNPESMGVPKIQSMLKERVNALRIALYGDDAVLVIRG